MSIYKETGWLLILLSALLATCAAAAEADINGLHPSAVEVASLPKFCWHKFLKPKFNSPEFKWPRSCGPYMNHYCVGLVQLNRANRSFEDPGHRRWLLLSAKGSFEYTLKNIRNEHCPLRGQVSTMERLVSGFLRAAQ